MKVKLGGLFSALQWHAKQLINNGGGTHMGGDQIKPKFHFLCFREQSTLHVCHINIALAYNHLIATFHSMRIETNFPNSNHGKRVEL